MKIEEIAQIIDILKKTDVTEFEIDQDGTHIKLTRGPKLVAAATSQAVTQIEPAIMLSSAAAANGHALHDQKVDAVPSHFVKVESPIVGTFYRKPSPEAEPFVKEGMNVKKGQTLCIVEAMKLMNPIEAPCDGKVEKVMLSDGHVVEFGETLFLINPQA